MSECKYKRTDGACEKLSDDEVTEYCVEGPCPYDTVMEKNNFRKYCKRKEKKFHFLKQI